MGDPPTPVDHAEPHAHSYTIYGILVGLLLSVAWPRISGSKPEPLSEMLGVCLTCSTILNQVFPRKKSPPPAGFKPQPFQLRPSFMSGWYGGIVGGAIAGIIIGPAYYWGLGNGFEGGWQNFIALVFGYAVLTGFFFGATSQLGAQFARYLATQGIVPATVANEVTGGLLGGALGGASAGAYGGWIFGWRPTPVINPVLLTVGGVAGAFAVCGGVLLYEYRGRFADIARVLFYSLIPTLTAAIAGFFIIVAQDIGGNYFGSFDSRLRNLEGGVYMGAIGGATLGIQVGYTFLQYRLEKERDG